MYPPDPTATTTNRTDDDVRHEIIETVRRFVGKEVIPVASELEHEDRYPAEIVARMRDLGLFGVTIPETYGGLGLDLLTYIGVIEELAYGWMSLTGVINTHTMAATLIMAHGNDEQKQRWLPILASGEPRGALSLSEPDAGSDTRNISCRATRDGDEYVLNGTKAWVTNGERAGLVALAARTHEGISAFVVEKEPGPEFEGISVAALAYAQQRETFGKPIGEHQAIQLKLADMATRLQAARLLTRDAAERKAAGLRCDVEAGMAKLFASETALELAMDSMRIHGGVGYTTELPVERYYRDAPLMVIGEGTNEIQRLVIARGLLARARG
jgi:alkylation response protein AidB-like acyl-CoA dehydrogenase